MGNLTTFDLGFGNSVAVRRAFAECYHQNPMYIGKEELIAFDYPKHEGDPDLVELTKKVVKRQTGLDYRHLFLVNGATGGCVIALRAYKQMGFENCVTRKAPYYIRYPKMIEATGLQHIDEDYWQSNAVCLLDLPSNPQSLMTTVADDSVPTIIDGVYLSGVYMPVLPPYLPVHKAMVGSYSKLLGINGIRVGWLATNDDLLAERFRQLVTSEYCGLSTASTELLKHCLVQFNWERFEQSARMKLDCNREELSVLEKYLGDTPVPNAGMFWYAPMDEKAQKLFTKAGVTWTKGSTMGTSDEFARLNVGQDNELIAQAVEAILKADRSRKKS